MYSKFQNKFLTADNKKRAFIETEKIKTLFMRFFSVEYIIPVSLFPFILEIFRLNINLGIFFPI